MQLIYALFHKILPNIQIITFQSKATDAFCKQKSAYNGLIVSSNISSNVWFGFQNEEITEPI